MRRSAPSAGLVATAPVSDRARRDHASLAARGLNFTPVSFDAAAADPAWHVDHGRRWLPDEAPGPPAPRGPFATARRLLRTYAFADPSLVRAVYDPRSPLDGRDLLLVGRFAVLRFHLGVRVGGVVDAPDSSEGRPVHRFRFHYRTLEHHLERGQMDYELLKHADTGRVEFRIHAYSQNADDVQPVVRLGAALFARDRQLAFYVRALDRMVRLVRRDAVTSAAATR